MRLLMAEELSEKYPTLKDPTNWKGNRIRQIFICTIHGDFECLPGQIYLAQKTGNNGCLECRKDKLRQLLSKTPVSLDIPCLGIKVEEQSSSLGIIRPIPAFLEVPIVSSDR